MTPHAQFFVAALVALTVTSPPIVAASWRRLQYWRSIIALFLSGYALIAATFVIDDKFNPPLFFHGFLPGIGIGLVLASLGISAAERRYMRQQ